MPDKIAGLPDSIDLTDSRLRFPVGKGRDGGLELMDMSAIREITKKIDDLARVTNTGNKVIDLLLVTVPTGGIGVDLNLDSRKVQVEYRNVSEINSIISVKIKTVGEFTTSGSLLLSPGTSRRIGTHKGFFATSESAPSYLEVQTFE